MRGIVDQVPLDCMKLASCQMKNSRGGQVNPGGGGPRWTLTSQVGRGPWSTWASPVLLLCNGDTHTAPLTSGWSSRANPILWPLVANKKLASGKQVHILFWASPALH